jgi:4-aminobutyrate aminotransferase-like enzyme
MVKPGGIEPDSELASAVVRRSVEKGLLMFEPVGYAGASVKVSPPLVITDHVRRPVRYWNSCFSRRLF